METTIIILGLFFLFVLFLYLKHKFRIIKREWNAYTIGRSELKYFEIKDRKKLEISIDAELAIGNAQHIFYFPSEEEWDRKYSKYFQNRREEILQRIKQIFPPDRNEYFVK
jgi:hypothetical protein